MHALIVGGQGVGKSTLIHRVLDALACPVTGFVTRKEESLSRPETGVPLYLYPAGQVPVQNEETFIGYCRQSPPQRCAAAFDRHAPALRALSPASGVILMDEIGVMESASKAFCGAILTHLDGNLPVIAAVKHKDTEFLNKVRGHANCQCFHITEENRERLYPEVLDFMQEQLFRGR